jgi:hypothetical protein
MREDKGQLHVELWELEGTEEEIAYCDLRGRESFGWRKNKMMMKKKGVKRLN